MNNPEDGRLSFSRRLLTTAKSGWRFSARWTSQIKNYPFEVAIPSGSKLSGVILADQVKSLDWRIRRAEFICKLPQETMLEVTGKLATLL